MQKRLHFIGLIIAFFFVAINNIAAQETDTFFLAKKKGLLGRLGKSISTNAPDEVPQKVENQYLKYKGKIIRSIELVSLGFQRNIYDTNLIKYNIGIRLANAFHKNSKQRVLKKNLFFEEGGRLYPYLLADNERYLRALPYIQDARIIVVFAEKNTDSVDVFVISKDIFSIGAKAKIDDLTKGRVEVQEENVGGTGTRFFISGFYDDLRKPKKAVNVELTKRNIGGSFIDWTIGYNSFARTFNSGKREETNFFTRIEKPLVTPYIPTTGSLEAGYYQSKNTYTPDSLYKANFRYAYYNIDGWLGYSLDNKRRLYANKEIRVHNFIALRGFKSYFFNLPERHKDTFDFRYTNSTGGLASINIFKQVFYKTNFIYGFGRNEDVPEGFSAALTAGYTVKQNDGYFIKQNIKRPYVGFDFSLSNYKNKGFYSNYTFKTGSYFFRKRFEDFDVLFNVEHFTRLKKLAAKWYQRTFISTGITAQINPAFNTPLFINSNYGLPYFNPENLNSDLRSVIKLESVFYNTHKTLGFRIAPFIFTDLIMLKPFKANIGKSDLYSAFGGGVRTRNENLVFGTIELKGYYFPRTNGDMKGWKVEVSTNLRFKYLSSFINRPDFVRSN